MDFGRGLQRCEDPSARTHDDDRGRAAAAVGSEHPADAAQIGFSNPSLQIRPVFTTGLFRFEPARCRRNSTRRRKEAKTQSRFPVVVRPLTPTTSGYPLPNPPGWFANRAGPQDRPVTFARTPRGEGDSGPGTLGSYGGSRTRESAFTSVSMASAALGLKDQAAFGVSRCQTAKTLAPTGSASAPLVVWGAPELPGSPYGSTAKPELNKARG